MKSRTYKPHHAHGFYMHGFHSTYWSTYFSPPHQDTRELAIGSSKDGIFNLLTRLSIKYQPMATCREIGTNPLSLGRTWHDEKLSRRSDDLNSMFHWRCHYFIDGFKWVMKKDTKENGCRWNYCGASYFGYFIGYSPLCSAPAQWSAQGTQGVLRSAQWAESSELWALKWKKEASKLFRKSSTYEPHTYCMYYYYFYSAFTPYSIHTFLVLFSHRPSLQYGRTQKA